MKKAVKPVRAKAERPRPEAPVPDDLASALKRNRKAAGNVRGLQSEPAPRIHRVDRRAKREETRRESAWPRRSSGSPEGKGAQRKYEKC
jgi:uncharacterized protein YdeI (YjbR/CyaY-like superfamily)